MRRTAYYRRSTMEFLNLSLGQFLALFGAVAAILRRSLSARPHAPQTDRLHAALLGRARQSRAGHAPQQNPAASLASPAVARHAAAAARDRGIPVRRHAETPGAITCWSSTPPPGWAQCFRDPIAPTRP